MTFARSSVYAINRYRIRTCEMLDSMARLMLVSVENTNVSIEVLSSSSNPIINRAGPSSLNVLQIYYLTMSERVIGVKHNNNNNNNNNKSAQSNLGRGPRLGAVAHVRRKVLIGYNGAPQIRPKKTLPVDRSANPASSLDPFDL